MKSWTKILSVSTMACALATTAANASFTAQGQYFGSYNFGLSDTNKGNGVQLDRARAGGTYDFGGGYSSTVMVESQAFNIILARAYVTSQLGGGTLTTGRMDSPYINSVDGVLNSRWIGVSLAEWHGAGAGAFAAAQNGVNYGVDAGPVAVNVALTNVGAAQNWNFNLGLGYRSDMFGLNARLEMATENTDSGDAKAMNYAVAADVSFEPVKLLIELASTKAGDNDAVLAYGGAADVGFGAASLYLAYHMVDSDQNNMIAGVHTDVAQGVNTGLFFSMAKAGGTTENMLSAKIGAQF
jgi:hypothetical protein